MSQETLDMLFCYTTTNNKAPLKTACVAEIGERISGDGPVKPVIHMQVVAVNIYNHQVYLTHAYSNAYPEYSECEGPNAIRGVHHYYGLTDEQYSTCYIGLESNETI